jgi:hypothetical protein
MDENINGYLLFNIIGTWWSTFHLHPHVGGFFEQDNSKVVKTSKAISNGLGLDAYDTLSLLHERGEKLYNRIG